ncbi:glycosyltransferase family 4 protein [Methanospirillum sp. J.3.6.1-F.2.7.3]|uniref:Glycosyltransferase family 4 protein n=1 Tax=Methanospirillum purgamenti TaxID=2834276 RepID=A0A8E7EIZ1_9EURY|nr:MULTISPECIES: glycosyltransferase family 4 protein [Methanospirillum]MDX8548931.1 glycosyltransferase family 4 protein [Methanospirillum hungatei]QVV88619.1 glycosyltransferase family 4 protein [Methanospirillum sp. J.3.6.1-F.2.7.3]
MMGFLFCLLRYDLIHFHSNTFYLPFQLDIKIAKFLKKKVIIQYWGSDVIQTDIAQKYTLIGENALFEVYPLLNNEKKRKYLRKIQNLVDKSVVGDYSLLVYSPDSHVIRQAIDLSKFDYIGVSPNKEEILIVHAPTKRDLKGTSYIIAAIEKLKSEAFPITFRLVENLSHDEAIMIYKGADIVIDGIVQGPYGILAIECMALGKPVLDYINEAFIEYYPDLPIVNTNPDNLYDNVRFLLENPEIRVELGRAGRKYVELNHDAGIIAAQLMELYNNL